MAFVSIDASPLPYYLRCRIVEIIEVDGKMVNALVRCRKVKKKKEYKFFFKNNNNRSQIPNNTYVCT